MESRSLALTCIAQPRRPCGAEADKAAQLQLVECVSSYISSIVTETTTDPSNSVRNEAHTVEKNVISGRLRACLGSRPRPRRGGPSEHPGSGGGGGRVAAALRPAFGWQARALDRAELSGRAVAATNAALAARGHDAAVVANDDAGQDELLDRRARYAAGQRGAASYRWKGPRKGRAATGGVVASVLLSGISTLTRNRSCYVSFLY